MRRTMMVIILTLLSVVVLLLLLNFLLSQLSQSHAGTVYLKAGVAKDGDVREGLITRGEKYLTVSSKDHGDELFSWDQVRYISLKESSSTKLDKLIDSIDLISKLGIIVTLSLFVIGLYQFRQAQKWKREEFIIAAVKEFIGSRPIRNAVKMLESLAIYKEGREIELLPESDKLADRKQFVSNEKILQALTTEPDKDLGKDEIAFAIRDCFDALLSELGIFSHYIEQNFITKEALAVNLSYWIDLLGPSGKMSAEYKRRIFAYAEAYDLTGVEGLVRKYYKDFRWKRDIPEAASAKNESS